MTTDPPTPDPTEAKPPAWINPYVGPRAFDTQEQRFFVGRDEEIKILEGQVLARRASLFFAQSGAGKSSLLRAGLIPALTSPVEIGRGQRTRREQKMDVLPILTIGGLPDRSQLSIPNLYIFNALTKLLPNAALADLAGLTLTAALAAFFAGRPITAPSLLLIFDQFEELFTHYADHWPAREDFFQQVAEALNAYESLHVLFTMREDYIAELTPYVTLLPDQLRVRFRLERLKRDAAITAVIIPAARAGRIFPQPVAEALVDNLRRTQLTSSKPPVGRAPQAENVAADTGISRNQPALGDYVEPVHLQIVCQRLWEGLPPERTTILPEDVEEFGDVDQALMAYYNEALRRTIQATGVNERRLRAWFHDELITPARTRGLVYRGATTTADLDNGAVDELNNTYVIRADIRGNDTWYEIAHDRLIDPILIANAIWLATYANPLVTPTQTWLQSGRAPARLLTGERLVEAQTYAERNPNDLLPAEQEFLTESTRQQALADAQARQAAQRRRNLAIATILVIVLLAGLTFWALLNAKEARTQKLIADDQSATAVAAQGTAVAEAENAQHAEATAEARRIEADTQAQIALSRQLAAQAQSHLDDQPDLALLLALAANQITTTVEARGGLLTALEHTPALTTYLRGHTNRVWGLAYQPQGNWLASGGEDGSLQLWNPTTGHPVDGLQPTNPDGHIRALAVAPHGDWLASGNLDGTIALWNLAATPLVSTSLLIHQEQVNGLAFSPNGQLLASASRDGLALTKLATATAPGTTKWLDPAGSSSAAFSPDGRYLAVGHDEGAVMLWNLASHQPVTLALRPGPILSVAFSPDSQRLAYADAKALVLLSDLAARQPITLSGHTDRVQSLAFSQDGALLVSGSRDHSVRLWDGQTGAALGAPRWGHRDAVLSVAIRRDGQQIATGGADHTVILWQRTDAPRLAQPLTRHGDEVWSVAFSPDGRWLASGSKDQTITLWDRQANQPIPLGSLNGAVRSLAFSPDSATLASGDTTGAIVLWHPLNRTAPLARLTHQPNVFVGSVAFSPDGHTLASGGFDGTVLLWDLAATPPISTVLGVQEGQIWTVVFSRDGQHLLAGSDKGVATMWDVTTQEISAMFLYEQPLLSVALSPDGQYVAGGSADSNVILWDVQSQARVATLVRHTRPVYSVAFHPDSTMLASTGLDQTVVLWDVNTRRMIGEPLVGHSKPISALAFSPDGRALATASDDQRVLLWDVDLASWQARACRIANREFSDAEWELYFGNAARQIVCST
jgi:WD40 repeat protein